MKIKFISPHNSLPWLRQTPLNDGVFDGARFSLDENDQDYDFLVMYDSVNGDISPSVSKERTIFVSSEPPNVKRYNNKFLAQFGCVITSDTATSHPNIISSHSALPWHVGMETANPESHADAMVFSEFESWYPEKDRGMSVICSNKAFTPQHRKRLAFVEALKLKFKDKIDVYGRGFNEIKDKREALERYRYHIALENCDYKDYWTEKIADPFLSLTFPIYYGCSNLEEYFSPDSFLRIDIDDYNDAFRSIEKVIDEGVEARRIDSLIGARNDVLYKHNVFALLSRVAKGMNAQSPSSGSYIIRPESVFVPPPRMSKKVGRKMLGFCYKIPALERPIRKAAFLALRLKDRFAKA